MVALQLPVPTVRDKYFNEYPVALAHWVTTGTVMGRAYYRHGLRYPYCGMLGDTTRTKSIRV